MKLYIARDKDGALYLYDNMPNKRSEHFLPYTGYEYIPLDDRLFPEVTFENSPQEVELKLTKLC